MARGGAPEPGPRTVSETARAWYVMQVVRFSHRDAARILGVPPRQLRALARAGSLSRGDGGYDFLDLRCLRAVLELRARGVPLRRIRDTIERLRSSFPELDRPAASLRLAGPASGRLVVRIRGSLQEPGGQMLLEFGAAAEAPVRVLPDEGGRGPDEAVTWFELGCHLDALPGEEEAARRAYRRAVEADPSFADAWCNLGAAEHRLGRRAEAERAWREATRRLPGHVEARLNLAALLDEAGRHVRSVGMVQDINGTEVERFARYYFDRPHAEYLETVTPAYRGEDYTSQKIAELLAEPGAETFLDRILRLDVTTLVVDDPVKRVDNMTMAWGLEARVPFLDPQLVELAAQLPPELKLGSGGKHVLKQIARGLLPDAIIDRPKGYFPMPALKFVRGEFLDFMRDILNSDACRRRGVFNRAYVDKLLAAPDQYFTRLQGSKLWHLALLELWFQTHIDVLAE